ncbi:MAG: hypothetical protein PHF44_00235 [Candidatus Pacebacteria bacterium]|nr:hypothetical protein [Candidatus Paceibacterota bacterium]
MSLETFSLAILISSFLGLLFFVFRKIPSLIKLPEASLEVSGGNFFSKVKDKIKNKTGFKSFSPNIILQKIISQIRILSLKTDSKTFSWLKKMREKDQENKLTDDNYWEELKDPTEDSKDLKK